MTIPTLVNAKNNVYGWQCLVWSSSRGAHNNIKVTAVCNILLLPTACQELLT